METLFRSDMKLLTGKSAFPTQEEEEQREAVDIFPDIQMFYTF